VVQFCPEKKNSCQSISNLYINKIRVFTRDDVPGNINQLSFVLSREVVCFVLLIYMKWNVCEIGKNGERAIGKRVIFSVTKKAWKNVIFKRIGTPAERTIYPRDGFQRGFHFIPTTACLVSISSSALANKARLLTKKIWHRYSFIVIMLETREEDTLFVYARLRWLKTVFSS